MRSIKRTHIAGSHPIHDLSTYRPLPNHHLPHLDPFLFLNHHGYQEYPPNNQGLPFGPHPHRGMATVTFILEGDIMHKDSKGHSSIIHKGGVQYMTAGKGLIHSEESSDTFKKNGGGMEILQLWLNLPSHLKMTAPSYIGLEAEEIPTLTFAERRLRAQLLFGEWEGTEAAFESQYPLFLTTAFLEQGGKFYKEVPQEDHILCYIVRGKVRVNEQEIPFRNMVEFEQNKAPVEFQAEEDSVVIFGHGKPFGEPIVAQGPFVMNSQQQIIEAYRDYREGKFETDLS